MRLLDTSSIKWMLLIASFVLAGCASPPILNATTPADRLGGKAIVIVSITNDEDTGSSSTSVSLGEGSYRDKFVLGSAGPGGFSGSDYEDRYGRVYVLELAPGRHVFTDWMMRWGNVRVGPAAKIYPIPFEVRAGEILYLGNFHMQARFGRGLIGQAVLQSGLVEIRDSRAIDIPLAESKVPAIRGKAAFGLLPRGYWTPFGIVAAPNGPPGQTP